METKFTRSNYYKRSFTEYEVEACKRDAAKRAQGCNECSQTEYEVEAYNWDVADAHIFTAAPGAPAAKIEPRAVLDAEMAALAAEIDAAISASKPKTKQADALAAMDAEITALEAEIAAAKSNRINKLAAMDAEIAALEAEIAASRS